MSSFLVEVETIRRIVDFMDRQQYSDNIHTTSFKRLFKDNNLPTNDEGYLDLDQVGTALMDLNRQAVDYRYDETNQVQVYKHEDLKSSDLQVLKSLHCLMYQCSEGDIDKKPLYKFLVQLDRLLMSKVINELPEYNKAVWG